MTYTQSELLKAYKKNKWIVTKREYSGCYICTVGNNVFRIETEENRDESGNEWVVTTISGDCHDKYDVYVGHELSLRDAQINLVNMYHV